jgi:ABC-type protease/lipase transport system fused ATPase/permease subunit
MPFVGRGIAIDANGRAKAHAAVGAARNHHIGAVTVAGRPHAGQHVDVVIRGAAGAVDCQKDLAC